jgi:hypothetical protein
MVAVNIKSIIKFIYTTSRFFLTKKKSCYVFGDSHVEVFDFINQNNLSSKFHYHVLGVGGATALGLVNPNSKTDCLNIFLTKINTIPFKRIKLLFLLGEVDTGFIIWYRAHKYNMSIDNQLMESVQNYVSFIDRIMTKGFRNITILSAPLPTIQDNQDWGEVANLRKEIKASQKDRTALTIRYNTLLEAESRLRKIQFVNLDYELLNSKNEIIKDVFLNKDPLNHHLDLTEYSKAILMHL